MDDWGFCAAPDGRPLPSAPRASRKRPAAAPRASSRKRPAAPADKKPRKQPMKKARPKKVPNAKVPEVKLLRADALAQAHTGRFKFSFGTDCTGMDTAMIAIEMLGIKDRVLPVFASEVEPSARRLLEGNFPNLCVLYGDLTERDVEPTPGVDPDACGKSRRLAIPALSAAAIRIDEDGGGDHDDDDND